MPFRYPDPENVPLPPVGLELALEVVFVLVDKVVRVEEGAEDEGDETGLPDLGRYLIPVDEQLVVCPTGEIGTNVPVWTEPRTS
jgi:hypothetical protein